MKYIKFIFFFLYPLLINAQDINSICKNYVEKLGGAANIEKVESVSIEQVIYSNNIEIPQNTLIVPNKIFYQEIQFTNGKNIVSVYNGSGWQINPFVSGKPQNLSEKEVATYLVNSNIFGPLYDHYINSSNSKVKEIIVEGEKEIDKDKCYKLKVTYGTGFTTYIYISQKSYMIRKIESNVGAIVYSNYKKVNNVMFPFNTEITNNFGVATGEVINLKVNGKIDYGKFEKPL